MADLIPHGHFVSLSEVSKKIDEITHTEIAPSQKQVTGGVVAAVESLGLAPWLAGAILGLLSATLGTFGLVIQKWSANHPKNQNIPFKQQPVWMLGVLAWLLGKVCFCTISGGWEGSGWIGNGIASILGLGFSKWIVKVSRTR